MTNKEKINKLLRRVELLRSGGQTALAVEQLTELFKEIEVLKGDKGDQGEKGDKGDFVQGPRGYQGSQGEKGDTVQGPRGLQGEKGDFVAGPPGPKGDKGDKGDYVAGPPGSEGLPGKDGSPDSPEIIVGKLQSLKGEARLDASAIKNLPELIRELPTLSFFGTGGGQVKDIVAGSGIAIVKSDSGKFTISVTSSGGTPGGSTTQLQYNNAGVFGGITGATSDGTNVFVPTLYGSSAASGILNLRSTTNATLGSMNFESTGQTGMTFSQNALGQGRLLIGGSTDPSTDLVPGGVATFFVTSEGAAGAVFGAMSCIDADAAPQFLGVRTRGTIAARTTTQDGDTLFRMGGFGCDTNNLLAASGGLGGGNIVVVQDGSAGDGYVPGRINFYTTATTGTGDIRMVIRNDGKVGLGDGITTPGARLHVKSGANTEVTSTFQSKLGQTVNITQWLNSVDTQLASIDKDGVLTLGAAATTTGKMKMKGTTSGTVTQTVAAAAGTWTFTLPTSGGTANYVLSTDGSGVTDWVAQSGGGTTSLARTYLLMGG